MKPYALKSPALLRALFPNYIWRKPNNDNTVYLTFDDGPDRSITPRVLDILMTENVRATFFCVGYNAAENPEIMRRILHEGHSVGNHTFDHLDGFTCSTSRYLENTEKAHRKIGSKYFRPPYGRITPRQGKALIAKGYEIVMWDVLSGDFDASQTVSQVVKNVLKKTESGSIIVMHDSKKAAPRMLPALPEILNQLKSKGFEFGVL